MKGRAFSLLEVMVAIAILAVGMTVLLQVQTRSVRLAQEAREMTVATMLARSKLLDCQADLTKKGFSIGDYDEEGNFGDDGYDKFYWECHAYKPDIPVADAADVQQAFSASGNEQTGEAVEEQAGGQADLGMQFLAPVMSQLSSVLGDSIRELVVIVRWGEGAERQEMSVATHVIDKTAVNQVAGMIQQATSMMPGAGGGASGGGAGGGGAGGGGAGGGRGGRGGPTPPVPVPGGGKG